MSRKETLLDYLEIEDIDESFHEEYDDDDIEFEIEGTSYLVLTDDELNAEIRNYVEGYVDDIKLDLNRSDFNHLNDYINWDEYITDECGNQTYEDIFNCKYVDSFDYYNIFEKIY